MAHLVDKDRIVAEIDRRLADNKKEIKRATHKHLEEYFEGYEDALVLFKEKFLATLEVKEVDLGKEIKNSIDSLSNLYCFMEELFNGTEEEGVHPIPEEVTNELFEFAKHFFELGLKTQKGE